MRRYFVSLEREKAAGKKRLNEEVMKFLLFLRREGID